MASPATALLQAFNGKTNTTPGNNYGGYNPFGSTGSTTQTTDPGAQAQNDVANSQSNYQSQQDSSRSQLQTSLQASSVGGQLNDPNSSYSSNNAQTQLSADPFAQFNNLITQVNQNGQTATDAANQAAAASWAQKISGLANSYNKNISQPASWSSDEIGAMLSKLGVTPNMGVNGQYGLSTDASGQYNVKLPAGVDPNSLGARAVAIARQSLGVPYVYGGNSLTQGVDCSGLVQQVYARLGIQLPRTSTEQAKYGKVVQSLSQALPGDLILMYSPYEPAGLQQYGHVGIYIGNGLMLDAPHTGAKVRIEQISNMTKIVRPW